jgi:Porin subfamily
MRSTYVIIYCAGVQIGTLKSKFPPEVSLTRRDISPVTGDFKTNKAYGIAGGLNHNWTPTWQTNVFGSWMRFDAPASGGLVVPVTAATLAAGSAGTVSGLVDFNEYRIGANTIWTPVSGLQLGIEVLYTRVDPRGRVAVPITIASGAATGAFKSTGSEDAWEGRLRIQRDF